MKILFVADVSFSFPTSGAEEVLSKQAFGLSHKDIEVFAITRKNGNSAYVEYKDSIGVKEACYNTDIRKIIKFLNAVYKIPSKIFDDYTKKNSFVASICHQPFTCYSLIVKRKIMGVPLIYVFHSPNHEEYLLSCGQQNGYSRYIQAKLRRGIEAFCLKRSQKVMVLSQFMKQKVIDIHRIPEDQIVVNPGGVDLKRFAFQENRIDTKEELMLPTGKIHLLSVRNLEPRMGLDNLLKAIYLLDKKGANLHLTIGGDGPEKLCLENLIKDFGLESCVTMTGFIPSEQLPSYYGAADFSILPTRDLEGFGLVTVESLACGTPVLGTPVGGTKEILSNFSSAFLFNDATPAAIAKGIESAMDDWLHDKTKYEQLRFRCREYVEKKYSWQRHVSQLKSMIDELTVRYDTHEQD